MLPGASGYGDPCRRPPNKVLKDVEMGFVSRAAAASEYGVVVVEESIHRGQDCQIRREQPYEERCPLQISENTMHSFQGQHNVIQWKLMVRGQGTGWQSFERCFPVVIAPVVSE